MKASELPRLAARIRLAGDRLETAGSVLWERSLGWKHGPGAANLEPFSRGTRHDEDGSTVPIDPTGEAALDGLPATQGTHAELRARLARVEQDVEWLNRALAPFVSIGDLEPATGADFAVEGWCRSCARDGGYLEPVARNKAGQLLYRDLCRWCGTFKAAQKQDPPLTLVKARHLGERITEQMVTRALRRTG